MSSSHIEDGISYSKLSEAATKIGFQDRLSLNAGQKYLLLTFSKLPFVIKIFGLSIFEWPFKTGLRPVLMYLYHKYWPLLYLHMEEI